MLTNLMFLEPGKTFPPEKERNRLKMYENNRKLFESDHAVVYEKALKRIERVIGNFQDVVSYPIVLNFQKLMSLKIADLMLGEPPEISSEDQDTVERIIENSDLINTCYQIAIDVSRYGDGLMHVRKNGETGKIDIGQPQYWFPVVSPDNVKEIVNHVIAWDYDVETSGSQKTKYLKAKIHFKGNYEERVYEMTGNTIVKMISKNVVRTGLDDFAIVPVSNTITSDRITGIDDYTDVDSLVADLMVRVAQIDRILDKHASPSMSGPQSALEMDPVTGEWRLKTGNYYPRETTEDPPVAYLTWDGQLEANFKQIEKLTNMLYTISEMGSALFGDITSTNGAVPSGAALKRLMQNPLSKVARIRTHFDHSLKQAIALCSQLGGDKIKKLKFEDISINWQDGLIPDFLEDSEIIKNRTGGKSTMSQKRVLMMFDGMSEEDAEEEIAMIQDEEMAITEAIAPPFSAGEESTPEEE